MASSLNEHRGILLLIIPLLSQSAIVSLSQQADQHFADETVSTSGIHGAARIQPGATFLPPINFHSSLLNLTLSLKLRDNKQNSRLAFINSRHNKTGSQSHFSPSIHIYQDFITKSALAVFQDESGVLSYRGLLTADTTIEPATNLSPADDGDVLPRHRDTNGNVHRSHLIRRRRRSLRHHDRSTSGFYHWPTQYRTVTDDGVQVIGGSDGGAGGCSLPKLTAEVVILMDNQLFEELKSQDRVLEHSLTYISAMEVHFSTIECPRIEMHYVNTAGMTSFSRESFFNNHILDENKVDIEAAMPSIAKYLYRKNNKFESFDVVLLLTKRNLCCRRNCRCDGMAYVRGACTMNQQQQTISTFVVVEEDSSFRSVPTAVHEFGHLMSSRHDGDKNSEAKLCSSSDGFVMASSRAIGDNQFHWSSCSKESINKFARSGQSECMKNRPELFQENVNLNERALTADEQCHTRYGSRACSNDHTICRELYCNIGANSCTTNGPAMEGTPCNRTDHQAGHCHLGHCL